MDTGTQRVENRYPQQGRESLLRVEDEDSVREVTYKLLTGPGYQVTAIEDGEHVQKNPLAHPNIIRCPPHINSSK